MAGRLKTLVASFVIAVALPAIAAAQSSFTGVVKDTSGGVLPGVTVEASSPVLIEGSKSDITNANGQYRITDLRPGTYTVTFSLP
ncbi:MAG: carboxypeptidase regulatory-like domain-containing protein, partial [Acidobacteria bacterium]|nr:carboxypeptidase regulatory-like domain-containing protein [Acidobacteriota bacterium]